MSQNYSEVKARLETLRFTWSSKGKKATLTGQVDLHVKKEGKKEGFAISQCVKQGELPELCWRRPEHLSVVEDESQAPHIL